MDKQQEAKITRITIRIDNVYSKLEFPDFMTRDAINTIKSWVKEDLSYRPKGYMYMPQYRNRKWDGFISLFDWHSCKFLTGLVPIVQTCLKNHYIKCAIIDERIAPEPKRNSIKLNGIEPRDYQIESTRAAVQRVRGILDMGTGAGKTEVACAIIQYLGLPTLFIVNKKALLFQTKERFEKRLGVEVSVFGDGKYEIGEITVASVQSLKKHLPSIKNYLNNYFQVVFVDECHNVSNNSYLKVLNQCNAYYRFGLSGTPLDRTDNANLYIVGAFGPVIYKVSSSELIEDGILVTPKIFFVPSGEYGGAMSTYEFTQCRKWQDVYYNGIVINRNRNELITHMVEHLLTDWGRKNVLVLIREIEHGRILQEKFEKELMISVPFVHGSTNKDELKSYLNQFKKGKLPILIASTILDEGIDLPNISSIVLACGGESTIRSIQRIGRGIRKTEGKEDVVVIDFIDDYHYILKRHSQKRMRTCKREPNFEVHDIGEKIKKEVSV